MALSVVGLEVRKCVFVDGMCEICGPGLVHQRPFQNITELRNRRREVGGYEAKH